MCILERSVSFVSGCFRFKTSHFQLSQVLSVSPSRQIVNSSFFKRENKNFIIIKFVSILDDVKCYVLFISSSEIPAGEVSESLEVVETGLFSLFLASY